MTEEDMRSLCIRHTHPTMTKSVKSSDFHHSGALFAMAIDDDLKILALEEEAVKDQHTASCTKCGLDHVKFCTESNRIALASNKNNNYHIKFLDTEAKSFIFKYERHRDRITGLHWSPHRSDVLVSTSRDKTCRLWALNERPEKACIAKIHFETSAAIASLQPLGAASAISFLEEHSNVLRSIDLRQINGKYPFEIKLNFDPRIHTCTSMQYSPDGKKILITTNMNCQIVAEISNTEVVTKTFHDYKNTSLEHIGASFDPFSNFLIGGSSDGYMHIWDIKTERKPLRYKLSEDQKVLDIKANPKYFMFASIGSNEVNFWNSQDD